MEKELVESRNLNVAEYLRPKAAPGDGEGASDSHPENEATNHD